MSEQATVPKTAKDRGKIAPAKFAHIVLRTPRYEAMINWYKTVLEAEIMMSSPFVSFITYDDEHHRVAFVNNPELSDLSATSAGVDHFAFTYESLDDLFKTYERLKAESIMPFWCINHGPTLSMYYRDPDGNQIELQIDIFKKPEEVNEWLNQNDFEVNPIGVKFVPEELIQRLNDGEAQEELLKRPVIDPSELAAQFPSN